MAKVSYLLTLFKMNLRELGALRLSALLQVVFMLFNNLVFFVFWIILYSNTDSIRGMGITDVAFIFGAACSAFGLAIALAGGSLRLAELVSAGRLDVYLTQPRDVLLQTLTARPNLTGWGDFLTGIILIAFYWGLNIKAWIVFFTAVICGAMIALASLTIYQSIIFWLPRGERLADQLVEFLITFMIYPNSLFSGPIRSLTYTLIPAAYIAFVPSMVVRGAGWHWLLISIFAALIYWFLARKIFAMGLQRYESGNQFVQVR